MNTKIRFIIPNDLPYVKSVIDSTGLFPSELLDGMTAPYFDKSSETDFWITYEEEGLPIAIAYFAPERMTSGTYNLYLIAVHSAYQGMGFGKSLLKYIEDFLRERGERILLVETSGLALFENTRSFYLKNGYVKEACIREFYAEGEDKIVFWKFLGKASINN